MSGQRKHNEWFRLFEKNLLVTWFVGSFVMAMVVKILGIWGNLLMLLVSTFSLWFPSTAKRWIPVVTAFYGTIKHDEFSAEDSVVGTDSDASKYNVVGNTLLKYAFLLATMWFIYRLLRDIEQYIPTQGHSSL
jgi:uncharacterized YccA/Bax inhibitor family protein